MYYYLGHVAHFVQPGATRVGVRATSDNPLGSQVATAVLTAHGERLVIVVMNRHSVGHDVSIHVPPRGFVNLHMAAHSIRTFVLRST